VREVELLSSGWFSDSSYLKIIRAKDEGNQKVDSSFLLFLFSKRPPKVESSFLVGAQSGRLHLLVPTDPSPDAVGPYPIVPSLSPIVLTSASTFLLSSGAFRKCCGVQTYLKDCAHSRQRRLWPLLSYKEPVEKPDPSQSLSHSRPCRGHCPHDLAT